MGRYSSNITSSVQRLCDDWQVSLEIGVEGPKVEIKAWKNLQKVRLIAENHNLYDVGKTKYANHV